MKKAIIFLLFSLLALAGFSQSESHDFITYDSAIYVKVNTWDSARFSFRISRPRILDGRDMYITVPGKAEQGVDPKKLQVWGPHYWLNKGWDGSVNLANGVHYPILVTMITRDSTAYPNFERWDSAMTRLIRIYKPNPKGIHLAGLSYGSWVVSGLAGYNEFGKLIASITALSGAGTSTSDYRGLGHWAKLGGKAFFTVGYLDHGNDIEPPKAAKAMQDSAAGSVYFTYNSVDNGYHGDWNTIYNPANNMWLTGKVTVNVQYPGTYKDGWNIYQWALRQGDTSLVGTSVPPPVILPPPNKYPVPVIATRDTITAPIAWLILDGSASYDPDGTIDSVAFAQVSGPSAATIIYNSCGLTAGIVGLIPGTYVFKLQVWDNQGATSLQLVSVIVNPAPITTIVSIPLSYTIFGVTVSKTIIVKSDGTYLIQ